MNSQFSSAIREIYIHQKHLIHRSMIHFNAHLFFLILNLQLVTCIPIALFCCLQFSQTTLVPLFHSLVQAFGELWLRELPCHRRHCLPAHLFCDNSIDFLDTNRLGGVYSHLAKKYREQCQQTVAEAKQQALVRTVWPANTVLG